ncbi:MAG: B12-binding domain-containing radical SAM protein [Candidatus Omnitrophota bacterium]
MKNILLVNPWIYDFSAYDFGMKPVGLLRVGEYLRRNGNRVCLLDCLSGCAKSRDERGFSKIRKEKIECPEVLKTIERPYFRYGISLSDFLSKLEEIKDVDEIFVTSGMTYWYPGVRLAIKFLRERFRKTPIILGGIYATLCHKHAVLTSGADMVCKGDYVGKKYFLEPGFYPAYDLLADKEILPIQLTSGCPFKCSYCASKILSPRFEMRDPVDLFEEVMHYNKAFGTNGLVFYDDALTCRSQDGIKKFLRLVAASGAAFTFHTPNGLHARYIDEELAELFKKANFRDLRLSLETSDSDLQDFTGGKVTNQDLKLALRNLKEAGYNKSDLGVYILMGAGWLDMENTMKDIFFVNSLGAKAVLASYSPIPGTLDYTALVKAGIIERGLDPLWHNKTIFAELLMPSYVKQVSQIRRFAANLNKTSP